VESIKYGRFDELKRHLDGLIALYDIDGDKYVEYYLFIVTCFNADNVLRSAMSHSFIVSVQSLHTHVFSCLGHEPLNVIRSTLCVFMSFFS
jgi:hypothetical protein